MTTAARGSNLFFMRNALAALILAATAGCGRIDTSGRTVSTVSTDLGSAGNDYVAQRFAAYKGKRDGHCGGGGAGLPRVLFSGFAKFSGKDHNISGVVAASLLQGYWPARLDAPVPGGLPPPARSVLADNDFGGRAQTGVVAIGGRSFVVCTLLLEVTWDLAAAIILHEAAAFAPDFIYMTGVDGSQPRTATFEHYSTNAASASVSYDGNGAATTRATARRGLVLPNPGVPASETMRWDNQALAAAAAPLVTAYVRPDFRVAGAAADEPGDYICNNVSFVVLNALAQRELWLAGGQIFRREPDHERLDRSATSVTAIGLGDGDLARAQAGFMHYPWDAGASTAEVYGWAKVVAATVAAVLPQ